MQYPPQPHGNKSQPISKPATSRRWFHNKRFQVAGGLLGIFVAAVSVVGVFGSTDTAAQPPEELAFTETTDSDASVNDGLAEEQAEITSQATEATPGQTFNEPDSKKPTGSWEADIEQLAQSDLSKSQKFDLVEPLTEEHPLSEQSAIEAVEHLTTEFAAGHYIEQLLQDEEYALRNIFLSRALDHYIDDDNAHPADAFAVDFYQNSQHIYRGADTPTSAAFKANEEQMQTSLVAMFLQD